MCLIQEYGRWKVAVCHSLVSCMPVYTCFSFCMDMCRWACRCKHTLAYTHIAHTQAHSCRRPHPAEPDPCLAPVLYPPLSLLISSAAEEVLQETTARAHCSDLACMSGAISSRRLHGFRMQSRAKKKESRGSWLLSTPSASGSCPPWLRKNGLQRCLNQRGLRRQQPGHEPKSFV